MAKVRPLHQDFEYLLDLKDTSLITLFCDLREYILELCPKSNELLYHTHALTAVYSLSEKLSDAFCHIPVYTRHINLGFNKGALLDDPSKLLTGSGKLIRHIEVKNPEDYRNLEVKSLIATAIAFAENDMEKPSKIEGKTISKIKRG